jgi:signal transduction histidine kinase
MRTQGQYPDVSGEPVAKPAGRRRSEDARGAVDLLPARKDGGADTLVARALEEHAGLLDRFSHDVRGVLGAADGYAQLLELRLAGPLSVAQELDIARIRALLHAATQLVTDVVHSTQEKVRMETRRRAG